MHIQVPVSRRLNTKMTNDKDMECCLTFYVDNFVNNTQLYHYLYKIPYKGTRLIKHTNLFVHMSLVIVFAFPDINQ